jgi:hypothetical protein
MNNAYWEVNKEGHNVKFEVLTAVTADNHTLGTVAGDFSETLHGFTFQSIVLKYSLS